MTVAAAWCAAFLSAIAAKLGYRDFPLECSCSRMLKKAEKLGIRVETYGYHPKVGDWLIYDLDLNSAMDHIGVVIGTEGDELWVLEGNFDNTVKARSRIRYDDPRIYRYICPDYMELVERVTASGESPGVQQSYPNLDSVPEWARPTIEMLIREGCIRGVGEGDLGLDEQMIRVLVIIVRMLKWIGVVK